MVRWVTFLAGLVLVTGLEPREASAQDKSQAASKVSLDGAGDAPNAALQRALSGLARRVQARGGKLSAAFVDLDSGATLAEAFPELALNPASNQKLLVVAAALDLLGPHYRFTTGVYGKLEADRVKSLVLRGNGDPSLGVSELWRLVDALWNLGVREVEGNLWVDQSYFDPQFVPPAFEQQPSEWAAFRAPISAVAVEGNSFVLQVVPTSAGQPARISVQPPGLVEVVGGVRTEGKTKERKGGGGVHLTVVPEADRLVARVSGSVLEDSPRLRLRRRVEDPSLSPGRVLKALLLQRGIAVSGDVRLGGEQASARLAYLESPPLAVLCQELGKNSDNFYAEMLLKSLGAPARAEGQVQSRGQTNAGATSQAGAAAVEEWLRRNGAWRKGMKVGNGSGLFDANRVSARSLTLAIGPALANSKSGPEFLNHLSVGGRDGTLHGRFRDFRDSGILRAKTGTLKNVTALSGVLLSEGRPKVAFSVLINGLPATLALRDELDSVVEAAARPILSLVDKP